MDEHNKEDCFIDQCPECAEVEELDFADNPEQGMGWFEESMDDWRSNA